MQLTTILNRVQKFKCFVYTSIRWAGSHARPELEVLVSERRNSRARCSGCDDVAEAVRARSGWSQRAYCAHHAAYDLARLSGKKLIDRAQVLASFPFRSEPRRMRIMCAYLLLRERVGRCGTTARASTEK